MRARNPGGQTLLGLFLENAHGIHSSTSVLLQVRGDWQRVQASVVTSTSNRTAPSGLSTLVFLPIILAILVASDEATSNDPADVWRCHSRKGLSSSTRNCLSAMPLSISRTLKVSPPPKSQSSNNRCRSLCGGFLQPQKGVSPPCLSETPTTSNQPSSGNFGVKRGLGYWRGRKRFGMTGCPMKHRRSIQSSQGVLL